MTDYSLNDKWLRILVIPLSVPAACLAQMPISYPGRWDIWWKLSLIGMVFASLTWEICRVFLLKIRRKWPTISQTVQRIAVSFLIFAVFVFFGRIAILLTVDWLGIFPYKVVYWWNVLNNWLAGFIFWAIIGSIYEALYFFQNYRLALLRSETLKKEQARQQLNALKTRVNPHFLFNSLTTLSALIGENAPQAERFVDELSKVYRYLLRAGREELVPLGEELQFAKSYAFLLENRFGSAAFSLQLPKLKETQPDQSAEVKLVEYLIPTLTLQHAIDYFVRTQYLPLDITVCIQEYTLTIVGNHRPKAIRFDQSDNDWQQLQESGAHKKSDEKHLILSIPIYTKSMSL
ncbi:MAG TPA: histidine kinase [Saprospiraceae bacterium]|nr:histidine kinase [Saprospiraceae bacterium]HMQ82704.1 histidine kinase [Saprospiraceae bacterium]